MERIERGEVRWCRLERPNKTRPVVILTRNGAIRVLHEVIVAEITTSIRNLSSEVVLTPADGMPTRCVINLDYTHSVPKQSIGGLITVVNNEKLALIRTALLNALGFEA